MEFQDPKLTSWDPYMEVQDPKIGFGDSKIDFQDPKMSFGTQNKVFMAESEYKTIPKHIRNLPASFPAYFQYILI